MVKRRMSRLEMSMAKTPQGMTSRWRDMGLSGSSLGPTRRKSSLNLTRYDPWVTLEKKPVFLVSITLFNPGLSCTLFSLWVRLSS